VQRSTTTSRRTCQSDQALLALISRSRSTSYCCLVLHGRHLVTSRTDFSRSSTLFSARRSDTPRRSFATSPAGCEFQSGYASTCVLTHRCLNDTAPLYLAESIRRAANVDGRCHLRSSATTALVVPPVRRSTLGDRAFPVAAPRAWNSLPSAVRATPSFLAVRRMLKTFLFLFRSY